MNNSIYDLIYAGEHSQEFRTLIQKDFPQAIINDASDDIHYGRFSVEMNIDDREWPLWLMRNGLHNLSLHWEVLKADNPSFMMPLIKQVIAEQKEQS